MQDEGLLPLFSLLSRVILIIPITVIIVAMILRFTPEKKSNSQILSSSLPNTKPTPQSQINKQLSIDLKGPYVCHYASNTATISAYIKEKKILLEIREKELTSYYVTKDDCLYIWKKGSFSGQKMCGIQTYLSLFEQISSARLVNMDSINLSKLGLTIDFKEIISTCKKEDIPAGVLFDVPKQILFKNEEIKYPGYDLLSPSPLWSEYHRR